MQSLVFFIIFQLSFSIFPQVMHGFTSLFSVPILAQLNSIQFINLFNLLLDLTAHF